jgi:hypothetical protein
MSYVTILSGRFVSRCLADFDVIEHGGVGGQRGGTCTMRHDGGGDLCEWAPHQLLEAITCGVPAKKTTRPKAMAADRRYRRHNPSGILVFPGHRIIDEHGDGQRLERDEEEPVEEAHHLVLLAAV